jgi:CubicO group peptidase (beta-lactamase class C family)
VGFLIQEGRLSLGDRVATFFPEYVPDNPSPNLLALT